MAIGVDIGGTKIHFGLISQSGEILHQLTLPTLAPERKVMSQVISGIEEVHTQANQNFAGNVVAGIGIGSAGQINFHSGTVHYASSLIPDYTGTPIKEIVSRRFGLPVYVDNDVNVLALAEKYFGAGRGADHLLCLALGTGVGGALLVNGQLVHGAFGGAGEIGHISVDYKGPRCHCGNFGCLEMYASGTGISQRYETRWKKANPDLFCDKITAREVIARWLDGQPLAGEVMSEAIEALGAAVAGLIHTLNPQKVVIGGGIAEVGEPLFAKLREQVSMRTMPSMLASVEIVPAVMGDRSNMVGAAVQIWEYKDFRE
jgi:glucokinase